MAEPLFSLMPSTVVDALHAELRERMVRGDLLPGEAVTEARFVAEFGVARTTARGALERLLSEGLLERTPRRTLQVRTFTIADLEDVYCLREGLETAAVRRLARGRVVPDAALTAQRELGRVVDGTLQPDVRRRADVAFHRSLVSSSGSSRLERLHSSVLVETRLASHLLVAASPREVGFAVAEHEAVLAAVAAGDVDGAARAVADHLSGAHRRVVARTSA